MSFISYAQNFEDVMLWRALRQVQGGFYIDVGANDPVVDSVTKAFYDRGWRGINLEPVPRYYHDLQRQRPEDITLQLAAGATSGSFTLYEVESVRGWGTLDETMAAEYRNQGHTVLEIRVTVTPLAEICQQYVTGPIHFMKIDVEGAEEQVLKGMDFNRWRPWIIIAETRVPNNLETTTPEWESLLTENGYQPVYCDGINTFYLAEKQYDQLRSAFTLPPNALDGFVRYAEWQSGRYAEELEQTIALKDRHISSIEDEYNRLIELEQQHDDLARHCTNLEQHCTALEQHRASLEQQCANLEQHCAGLEQQQADLAGNYASLEQHCNGLEQHRTSLKQQLDAVYASSSWRVTAPLRNAATWLRGSRNKEQQP